MPTADAVIAELSALISSPQAGSSIDERFPVVLGQQRRIHFRAQFLGIGDRGSPVNALLADLRATEASTAMREAISMVWPPGAIGFRLIEVGRRLRPVGKDHSSTRTF
jgi:hypothetical protein